MVGGGGDILRNKMDKAGKRKLSGIEKNIRKR